MIIETQRLIIREFTSEDCAAVHGYASDPRVVKHMMWGPNTEEETINYLHLTISQQHQEPRKAFEFAVVLKETHQLIGGCGIHTPEQGQGEIGYCFNSRYWGQGFAAEAACALISFGFRQLALHRIYATCRPENTGSAKVLQKAGMRYEGHLRGHKWYKGSWHDSYQYSILEEEYVSSK
ncbi:GNAT family N-acetyltransferase [Paenibacillus sp. FSL L8-0463]|uniref:GNAT family N-acetyltransferase n=1 Tax=Paenibacillus sp. FSL L8-0463 TaxID=2954687 RepID=UPI00311A2AB8